MWKQSLIVAAAVLVAACKPAGVKTDEPEVSEVQAQTLFAGQMCAVEQSEPAVVWVTDQQAWQRWQSDSPRRPISLSEEEQDKPAVDFTNRAVAVIAMGQKPTAGYSISLAEPEAELEGDTLTLHVQTSEPEPGMMLAQVITSPCVAVQLPKVQAKTIRAVDETGAVLAEAEIP